MSNIRTVALLSVTLLTLAANVPALAHGGRYYGRPGVSVGFVFHGPAYWGYPGYWAYPGYYGAPYYYYPRVVGVPAEPTVYIERGDSSAEPESSQGYWYYCPDAKAYYPYVKHCSGAWQRVTPTPPSGERSVAGDR
jgi:hypothetical protein